MSPDVGELQELTQPVTAGDLVGFTFVNMDHVTMCMAQNYWPHFGWLSG